MLGRKRISRERERERESERGQKPLGFALTKVVDSGIICETSEVR